MEGGAVFVMSPGVTLIEADGTERAVAPGTLITDAVGPRVPDLAIARALELMHDELERDWTVASLAHRVGLSRAAFARRFGEVVGQPPLRQLFRLRMAESERLLLETNLSLAEIAARVGYASEFALSRAVRRAFGRSPRQLRQMGEDVPQMRLAA